VLDVVVFLVWDLCFVLDFGDDEGVGFDFQCLFDGVCCWVDDRDLVLMDFWYLDFVGDDCWVIECDGKWNCCRDCIGLWVDVGEVFCCCYLDCVVGGCGSFGFFDGDVCDYCVGGGVDVDDVVCISGLD